MSGQILQNLMQIFINMHDYLKNNLTRCMLLKAITIYKRFCFFYNIDNIILPVKRVISKVVIPLPKIFSRSVFPSIILFTNLIPINKSHKT